MEKIFGEIEIKVWKEICHANSIRKYGYVILNKVDFKDTNCIPNDKESH